MVSLETVEATSSSRSSMDDYSFSSPRISFSSDTTNHHLLDGSSNLFINSLTPKSAFSSSEPEFEFLSTQTSLDLNMLSADELFSEGKLLPFWQVQKLNHITLLKTDQEDQEGNNSMEVAAAHGNNKEGEAQRSGRPMMGWFVDEDPSPRPPNCTVLFKELLRLKKQRKAATLSPSSSSSSTSSSSSSLGGDDHKGGDQKKGKKVGLERTSSATIRIRPMVNVPICTAAVKTANVLPPLFPMKKGRLDRWKMKKDHHVTSL